MTVAAAILVVAVITEVVAGKSSDTHLLAESADSWVGSWQISR